MRSVVQEAWGDEKMTDPKEALQSGDGLLVVDVQKCFCPGGALPVEGGADIVPILNRWIEAAQEKSIPIYASRDWHPRRHPSFEEQGGEWPDHCIQDSEEAEFHPELKLPGNVVKITKGVRFDQDQNSVFDETGFAERLRDDGVDRLWIGGLALDVCVLATLLDARKAGFTVYLLQEATRPVTSEGGRDALEMMQEAGAEIVGY
jgi:nicotinamidase/pyrazinamidase